LKAKVKGIEDDKNNLKGTEESQPYFIIKNYRKTLKKNGLRNQIWIWESVTCGEGISTPQRPS